MGNQDLRLISPAASELGINRKTIRKLVDTGAINTYPAGKRVLIDLNELRSTLVELGVLNGEGGKSGKYALAAHVVGDSFIKAVGGDSEVLSEKDALQGRKGIINLSESQDDVRELEKLTKWLGESSENSILLPYKHLGNEKDERMRDRLLGEEAISRICYICQDDTDNISHALLQGGGTGKDGFKIQVVKVSVGLEGGRKHVVVDDFQVPPEDIHLPNLGLPNLVLPEPVFSSGVLLEELAADLKGGLTGVRGMNRDDFRDEYSSLGIVTAQHIKTGNLEFARLDTIPDMLPAYPMAELNQNIDKYRLQQGDILLNCRNGQDVAVVASDKLACCTTDASIIRIRLRDTQDTAERLAWAQKLAEWLVTPVEKAYNAETCNRINAMTEKFRLKKPKSVLHYHWLRFAVGSRGKRISIRNLQLLPCPRGI